MEPLEGVEETFDTVKAAVARQFSGPDPAIRL